MLTTLGIVCFLAVIGNRLVEALVTPLFEKYGWDKFYIMLIAWVLTTGLVLLSGANLFEQYFDSVLAGKILTGVLAGGGANLLHDIFDVIPKTT
jgi:hypothetical protein